MNALSCFDGMSCLQIALQRMGRKVDNYYASEIDKHAIRATQLNFPNTIQLGDIQQVHARDLPRLDLIAGGSPCQGFSFAGKGLNFEDPRSKLFFEFVRLVNEAKEINPDIKFLLENVMMEKWCQDVISKMLGVNPIRINSALVSAQNRDRLYWTNIGLEPSGLFGDPTSIITQPKDKGIVLRDILEEQVNEKYYLSDKALARIGGMTHTDRGIRYHRGDAVIESHSPKIQDSIPIGNIYDYDGDAGRVYSIEGKGRTIKGDAGGGGAKTGLIQVGVLNNNGTLVESNEKANCIDANFHKGMDNHSQRTMIVHREVIQINESKESGGVHQPYQQNRIYSENGIHPAFNAELWGRNNVATSDRIRRLTLLECCRLQTVPDNYFTDTDISETQQYRMLGNGWTIDVIVHILSYWK